MITVAEARQFVLSSCHKLAPAPANVRDALGLVLAEAVRSEVPVPPFANSSMDGYALRSSDVRDAPARLRVVAEIMAGDDPGRHSCQRRRSRADHDRSCLAGGS